MAPCHAASTGSCNCSTPDRYATWRIHGSTTTRATTRLRSTSRARICPMAGSWTCRPIRSTRWDRRTWPAGPSTCPGAEGCFLQRHRARLYPRAFLHRPDASGVLPWIDAEPAVAGALSYRPARTGGRSSAGKPAPLRRGQPGRRHGADGREESHRAAVRLAVDLAARTGSRAGPAPWYERAARLRFTTCESNSAFVRHWTTRLDRLAAADDTLRDFARKIVKQETDARRQATCSPRHLASRSIS